VTTTTCGRSHKPVVEEVVRNLRGVRTRTGQEPDSEPLEAFLGFPHATCTRGRQFFLFVSPSFQCFTVSSSAASSGPRRASIRLTLRPTTLTADSDTTVTYPSFDGGMPVNAGLFFDIRRLGQANQSNMWYPSVYVRLNVRLTSRRSSATV
jgi:hypothetical protein